MVPAPPARRRPDMSRIMLISREIGSRHRAASQCPLGYQQSKDNSTQCVPNWSCDPSAGEVPDPETYGKTCKRCGDHQRVATGMPIYNYQCEDCGKGRRVSDNRLQCIPQCSSGSITNTAMGAVDPATGRGPAACTECLANEYARYDQPGSSIGTCERCDPGTTSVAGQTACRPLDCGLSGYQTGQSECVQGLPADTDLDSNPIQQSGFAGQFGGPGSQRSIFLGVRFDVGSRSGRREERRIQQFQDRARALRLRQKSTA